MFSFWNFAGENRVWLDCYTRSTLMHSLSLFTLSWPPISPIRTQEINAIELELWFLKNRGIILGNLLQDVSVLLVDSIKHIQIKPSQILPTADLMGENSTIFLDYKMKHSFNLHAPAIPSFTTINFS